MMGQTRLPIKAAGGCQGIANSGWHDYFETVNADGKTVELTTHLSQLARTGIPHAPSDQDAIQHSVFSLLSFARKL